MLKRCCRPRTHKNIGSSLSAFRYSPLRKDSDQIALLPHDVCKNLQKHTVFESSKIYFLYIGQAEQKQINQATKKAYDEQAFENAKSMAELLEERLGKLVALTPEIDGRWRYWAHCPTIHGVRDGG